MTRHTVAFVGLVVFAVVTWVGTARHSPAEPALPLPIPSSVPVPPPVDSLRDMPSRVSAHLASPPPMPAVVRNPFEFGPRRDKLVREKAAEPAARAANDPVTPPPPLRLVGIAEDEAGGRPVRTAMITSAGQLFMVKVGDRLVGRYLVVSIGTDAVQVKDDGGTTVTLAMK